MPSKAHPTYTTKHRVANWAASTQALVVCENSAEQALRQATPAARGADAGPSSGVSARQGRAENAFFRYKSIIGSGLRARSPAGQGSEVVLGCEILNRMTDLGRSVSYRIGR